MNLEILGWHTVYAEFLNLQFFWTCKESNKPEQKKFHFEFQMKPIEFRLYMLGAYWNVESKHEGTI